MRQNFPKDTRLVLSSLFCLHSKIRRGGGRGKEAYTHRPPPHAAAGLLCVVLLLSLLLFLAAFAVGAVASERSIASLVCETEQKVVGQARGEKKMK